MSLVRRLLILILATLCAGCQPVSTSNDQGGTLMMVTPPDFACQLPGRHQRSPGDDRPAQRPGHRRTVQRSRHRDLRRRPMAACFSDGSCTGPRCLRVCGHY